MMRLLAPVLFAFLALAAPLSAEVRIQDVNTPAGFTAWLVEERSIPFVAIELIFSGGANLETDSEQGATSLMATLMTEGAAEMNAQQVAAAFEGLAGGLTFDAGRDSVSISIQSLSENRDEVMALVRTVLMEPRFDADALERVRRQALAGLEQAARNPNQIAGRRFNAMAFGTHPYARPTEGTLETVANLTRDDVLTAYRNAFTRDRVVIGAAGDISAEELATLLDGLLSDLPMAERPLPDYAEFGLEGGITVIDHPGPQSVVHFGHGGLHRDDPDFMAAFVMNEILGGGRFGTRLMNELREQRGLTYGVGTSLVSAGFGDSLQGRMSTDNSRAALAIAELRRQWEWLADGGITQTDLERAQTFMTGAYPLRFDGNGAIANIVAGMQFQGFDIDYVNIRNDLVRAVTLEDIHRVSRRLARPEALHFIVVGRPEGVEATTP